MQNARRAVRATLLVVLVAIGIGACGSTSSSSKNAGVAAASSGGSSSSGQGTAAPKTGFKIGYAVPVLANPYWEQNVAFARKMASELGISLVVENANSAEDTQLKNIEDLVAQGVKGIVFGPITGSIGPAILKVCQQNNLVCAAMARKPGPEPDGSNQNYYAGYVVGNDYGDGQRTAQALDQAGATNCVAMSGQLGNSVADDRLRGFDDYAKAHGMDVLSTYRPAELAQDGQQATENFLAQLPGPKFNCAFGFDGDVGTGTIAALTKAGVLNKVKVATMDTNPTNIQDIENGSLLGSAASGEYIDGGLAEILVYDGINGHLRSTRAIVLDGTVVTKANVAKYATQFGSGNPPSYDAKQLSLTYNPNAGNGGMQVVLK